MTVNDLSAQLWRERELLDLLLFKLDVQKIVLSQGLSRWSVHAAREVDFVTTQLHTATLARDVLVSSVAREWHLDEAATVGDLADNAPDEVWKDVLVSHIEALDALSAEVAESRASIARFLEASEQGSAVPAPRPYDERGAPITTGPTSQILDQDL